MGDKQPNNARKKQVIEQQSYLSHDFIIQEILTRLPVKSILRFKSVSKQWYSTLSSSDFANAHLIKSLFAHRSTTVNTLLIKNHKNYYLFSYDDDQVSNKTGGIQNYNAELTGSCNGLICLTIYSNTRFFMPHIYRNCDDESSVIWNPATRKVHRYNSDGYVKRTGYGDWFLVARGFGYTSSVGDYKYVRILTPILESKTKATIVHIFSLRENKWRKIDFGFDSEKFIPQGRAVLINEKLYWEAYSNTEDSIVIVSFDLEVERFEIIQFNVNNFDRIRSYGRVFEQVGISYKTEVYLFPKGVAFRPSLRNNQVYKGWQDLCDGRI